MTLVDLVFIQVASKLFAEVVGEGPSSPKPRVHRGNVIRAKTGQPAGIVKRLSNDVSRRPVPLQFNQNKRGVRCDRDKVRPSAAVCRLLAANKHPLIRENFGRRNDHLLQHPLVSESRLGDLRRLLFDGPEPVLHRHSPLRACDPTGAPYCIAPAPASESISPLRIAGHNPVTDAIALAAQPREREYAIHDETLRGFMLRVQAGGSRSWALRFRHDGKPRRVTLGKVGTMTADQARAAALALLAREKRGGRSLPPPASGPTLARFAAEYVERRSPSWKPSTHDSTMSYLHRAILPSLGALRVDAVTRGSCPRTWCRSCWRLC